MQRSKMLRNALLANAAFSAFTGLELTFFSGWIGNFMGFSATGQLQELGISLLAFAAVVGYAATRKPIKLWAAGLISAMDILWVVGTAGLLLTRPDLFNTAGIVTTIVVAMVVADFAFFQILGIRRLTSQASEGHDGGSQRQAGQDVAFASSRG